MPTDTAPLDVTVRTAAPVPVNLLNDVLPPNHGQI